MSLHQGGVAQDAALLRFLEIVVNRGPACPLTELLAELCSTAFTFEMRQAVGGATEQALCRFLNKFPSLFTIEGDLVAAASDFSGSKPTSLSTLRRPFDKVEQDAVDYFRSRFFKRETQWISIVSLAGHLSQASPEIRKVVGPQTDFKKFLIRHPEAFIVENQKVSLKIEKSPIEQENSLSPSNTTESISPGIENQGGVEDKVDKIASPDINGGKPPSDQTNNGQERRSSGSISLCSGSEPPNSARSIVVKLTPAEHRALMFVKQIVERRGPLRFHNLTGFFSQAPDAIRDTIGRSKYELEQFVHSYPQIFEIDSEDVVRVRRDARLNFIIVESASLTAPTGSRPGSASNAVAGQKAVRALHQRRARIFHLAKLWGTIDLGKHEHVFFDRSIFPREPAYDDLRNLFSPGQFVAFNAVLAPPSSRAKWRATCVWREDGRPPPDAAFATPTATLNSGGADGGMGEYDDLASILAREPSVIDELDWDCSNDLMLTDSLNDDFLDSCLGSDSLLNADTLISNIRVPLGLPEGVRSRLPLLGQLYADQGYMVVDPEVSEKTAKEGSPEKIIIPSPRASLQNSLEVNDDGLTNGHHHEQVQNHSDTNHLSHPLIYVPTDKIGATVVHDDGKRVDMACQTLSTGDILATHLYYS